MHIFRTLMLLKRIWKIKQLHSIHLGDVTPLHWETKIWEASADLCESQKVCSCHVDFWCDVLCSVISTCSCDTKQTTIISLTSKAEKKASYPNAAYQVLDAVAEFFTVQRSRAIYIKCLQNVVAHLSFSVVSLGRAGWVFNAGRLANTMTTTYMSMSGCTVQGTSPWRALLFSQTDRPCRCNCLPACQLVAMTFKRKWEGRNQSHQCRLQKDLIPCSKQLPDISALPFLDPIHKLSSPPPHSAN